LPVVMRGMFSDDCDVYATQEKRRPRRKADAS